MADGPVMGRLRRPGWRDPRLVVGLLLVAIAVTGVSVVMRQGQVTAPHFAARETLTPGMVLKQDDVVVTEVRVPQGVYVEASEAPWGQVVNRVVAQGELLPAAALSEPADVDVRPLAVRSSVPVAQGIEAGSLVDIYLTTVDAHDETHTEVIAEGLVVASVEREESGFGADSGPTVYVVVPRSDIEDLLSSLAIEGEISVVGLGG